MGNIAGNTDTVTGFKRISGSVQIENASAPLKHDGRIVPGMIMGNFLRADADPVDALDRRALQVRFSMSCPVARRNPAPVMNTTMVVKAIFIFRTILHFLPSPVKVLP